jgi:hypothetical protein
MESSPPKTLQLHHLNQNDLTAARPKSPEKAFKIVFSLIFPLVNRRIKQLFHQVHKKRLVWCSTLPPAFDNSISNSNTLILLKKRE